MLTGPNPADPVCRRTAPKANCLRWLVVCCNALLDGSTQQGCGRSVREALLEAPGKRVAQLGEEDRRAREGRDLVLHLATDGIQRNLKSLLTSFDIALKGAV